MGEAGPSTLLDPAIRSARKTSRHSMIAHSKACSKPATEASRRYCDTLLASCEHVRHYVSALGELHGQSPCRLSFFRFCNFRKSTPTRSTRSAFKRRQRGQNLKFEWILCNLSWKTTLRYVRWGGTLFLCGSRSIHHVMCSFCTRQEGYRLSSATLVEYRT